MALVADNKLGALVNHPFEKGKGKGKGLARIDVRLR
jgi:hypothetical protein